MASCHDHPGTCDSYYCKTTSETVQMLIMLIVFVLAVSFVIMTGGA